MSEYKSMAGFFNQLASKRDDWKSKNKYYYRYIEKGLIPFLVPAGKKVLEVGCGTGDLLASLNPSLGHGTDISAEMIKVANHKYQKPELRFTNFNVGELKENFDYVVISDVVGYVEDLEDLFRKIHSVTNSHSRIVITQYNHLWEPILALGTKLGIRTKSPMQNWLSVHDTENILHLAGFETVKIGNKLLLPKQIPLLSFLCNRFLVNIFPFNKMGLVNYIVARPLTNQRAKEYSVSIVVPARNEAGMIKRIASSIPVLGSKTELIFIEGNSSDNTREEIKRITESYQGPLSVSWGVQNGKGKGDAVRKGFDMATGDILMIYDADMTVQPEELPKFYHAIAQNRGEFINGSRLVYPMEKQSMRTLNYFGNKFFSAAFSWLLGQRLKDTLCGTKVLWKSDYEDIKRGRSFFGNFDPFGDFDLLFGAAKLNRKIVDLPVHYKERTYGTTNISRWSHGLLLLKMVSFAAKKIKFI